MASPEIGSTLTLHAHAENRAGSPVGVANREDARLDLFLAVIPTRFTGRESRKGERQGEECQKLFLVLLNFVSVGHRKFSSITTPPEIEFTFAGDWACLLSIRLSPRRDR